MTFIKRSAGLVLLMITLFLPAAADAAGRIVVVEENNPYLYGWVWDQRPDSMARIPRAPASVPAASDDQPLRVQREVPRYRHFRSAAQIHWEISQEASE